jgi:hypothetical protein
MKQANLRAIERPSMPLTLFAFSWEIIWVAPDMMLDKIIVDGHGWSKMGNLIQDLSCHAIKERVPRGDMLEQGRRYDH